MRSKMYSLILQWGSGNLNIPRLQPQPQPQSYIKFYSKMKVISCSASKNVLKLLKHK